MLRRVVFSSVFILILLGFIPFSQAAKLRPYQNVKYVYSLKYPSTWFLGFIGGSEKEAVVLRICSDENDVSFADDGENNPLVEIMVSDVGELKRAGAKLPEIKSASDWLNWERSNWDKPEKDRIGPYLDEAISVGGGAGVKTTYIKPVFPNAGPMVEVLLFNPALNLLYSVKYLGQQPKYEENLKNFEEVLKSFTLLK